MITSFITGISGQDGGYLAEQLVAAGNHVHGLVRPGEPVPEHLVALGDALVLHEAEILDGDRLRAALRAAQPDEVYNLAGVSSVAGSWTDPVLTASVNGTAVAGLLQLCWELQVEKDHPVRFLQASSAEIFAGATTTPQNERTHLSPRSPYGASKSFAHHLVHVFRERGLHAVNVVLYNHESPRRPPTFVTRKITLAVAAIARGSTERLALGNLTTVRDWGWAPEYADAMTRAVRRDAPEDYVVATGKAHTVADFVVTAFGCVGITDWRDHVDSDPLLFRPADPAVLVGCADKAAADLGWRALTAFEDVVRLMVDSDVAALESGQTRR